MLEDRALGPRSRWSEASEFRRAVALSLGGLSSRCRGRHRSVDDGLEIGGVTPVSTTVQLPSERVTGVSNLGLEVVVEHLGIHYLPGVIGSFIPAANPWHPAFPANK